MESSSKAFDIQPLHFVGFLVFYCEDTMIMATLIKAFNWGLLAVSQLVHYRQDGKCGRMQVNTMLKEELRGMGRQQEETLGLVCAFESDTLPSRVTRPNTHKHSTI